MNIGIIGAGRIAAKFCAAAQMLKEATVIAVASKDTTRAADFAAAQKIEKSYGSYEEMLNNPEIELVYIATTHNFHYENIKQCLEHGKHIICEKCMVLTSHDAREVFELAKQKGLFLMEAMWSRFLPIAVNAKKVLESNEIGELQFAHFAIGFLAEQDADNRIMNKKLAGGAMYDIGVYAIEMAEYWLGEISEYQTMLTNAYTGVDKVSSMLIRAGGVPATLQACISSGFPNYATIYGSTGYIELPHFNTGTTFTIKNRSGEVIRQVDCSYENGFQFQLSHVIECIKNGKLTSDTVPPSLTITCAEIFDHAIPCSSSCHDA